MPTTLLLALSGSLDLTRALLWCPNHIRYISIQQKQKCCHMLENSQIVDKTDINREEDFSHPASWRSAHSAPFVIIDQILLTHWVKLNIVNYALPIFLFQIRLQIKRSVARRNAGQISFKDRDVDDVVDGYVACEPYKDSHVWEHSQVMERAMQVIYFLKSI